MVGNWEDSVKLDTDKYLAQFGSFLVNDKVRRYEGYDYEKVMLTTQMALNLLAQNDFDGARTEIKKTHEREAVIAELRDKEYLKREDEAERKGSRPSTKTSRATRSKPLTHPTWSTLKTATRVRSAITWPVSSTKPWAKKTWRRQATARPPNCVPTPRCWNRRC